MNEHQNTPEPQTPRTWADIMGPELGNLIRGPIPGAWPHETELQTAINSILESPATWGWDMAGGYTLKVILNGHEFRFVATHDLGPGDSYPRWEHTPSELPLFVAYCTDHEIGPGPLSCLILANPCPRTLITHALILAYASSAPTEPE